MAWARVSGTLEGRPVEARWDDGAVSFDPPHLMELAKRRVDQATHLPLYATGPFLRASFHDPWGFVVVALDVFDSNAHFDQEGLPTLDTSIPPGAIA